MIPPTDLARSSKGEVPAQARMGRNAALTGGANFRTLMGRPRAQLPWARLPRQRLGGRAALTGRGQR
jgi:hypothetical protein